VHLMRGYRQMPMAFGLFLMMRMVVVVMMLVMMVRMIRFGLINIMMVMRVMMRIAVRLVFVVKVNVRMMVSRMAVPDRDPIARRRRRVDEQQLGRSRGTEYRGPSKHLFAQYLHGRRCPGMKRPHPSLFRSGPKALPDLRPGRVVVMRKRASIPISRLVAESLAT
jgi:hypothetical protein